MRHLLSFLIGNQVTKRQIKAQAIAGVSGWIPANSGDFTSSQPTPASGMMSEACELARYKDPNMSKQDLSMNSKTFNCLSSCGICFLL